jgi:DNA-binding transcriptional MerR regulator
MGKNRILRNVGIGLTSIASMAALANTGCVDVALWGAGTAISHQQRERHHEENQEKLDEMSRKIDDLKNEKAREESPRDSPVYSAPRDVSLFICEEWKDDDGNRAASIDEMYGLNGTPGKIIEGLSDISTYDADSKISIVVNLKENPGGTLGIALYKINILGPVERSGSSTSFTETVRTTGNKKVYSERISIDDKSKKGFATVLGKGLPAGDYRGMVDLNDHPKRSFLLKVKN